MVDALDYPGSTLLCSETSNISFDDLDCDGTTEDPNPESHHGRSDPFWGFPSLSEESVGLMVEREREHLPRSNYHERLRNGDLDLSMRREALDWIYKAHSLLNFKALSISLSVNYLDRFLSIHDLPKNRSWAVQLLAVACLSLAAKMEETEVPQSVYFQVGEPRFVFDAKQIQKMELLVLRKLNWRMRSLTPFSFVDYFLSKLTNEHIPPRTLMSRSAQLILGTTRVIDFLQFKPSEIAAAVALFVSGETLALEPDKNIWFLHVEKGQLLKCVELIRDLSMTSVSGRTDSSVPKSPIGILDAACFSYRSDAVGSCANSSHTTSPDAKRRKIDLES